MQRVRVDVDEEDDVPRGLALLLARQLVAEDGQAAVGDRLRPHDADRGRVDGARHHRRRSEHCNHDDRHGGGRAGGQVVVLPTAQRATGSRGPVH